MSDPQSWSFETRQIHAGTSPDPTTGARALPIYATTAYQFRDSQHAADLFALAEMGNIYTRIMNPTQDALEQRVASLEGGVAALAVASGQAAETLAILNVANSGDHVVASASLYGGTYNLLHHSLPKLGITVSFVEDPDDPENWQRLVQDNTKAFFAESIGNPKGDILDIEAVAEVAHRNGVPLMIDNTIATPYLIRPLEHGADVVVHSATKYLSGHGTVVAGLIVDGGTFDWRSGRFPGFTEPDPSYHGAVFADLGAPAFALKARVQLLRDLGPAVSPFNAFLVIQGIETLSLRMDRHVQNTQRVAEWLENHDAVDWVNYPGLPSSRWHAAAQKYAPKGAGAVLTFELHGGVEAGKKFVDALELHSHVANIGDVRSLVIHPASTTHSQLTPEEQLTTGVTPGLVRLAVGLEGIEDIIADLEAGFRAAKSA
ncbi:bifunctional o-acetylhomoserine/o-acetylserine sulfhydrylase [Blastococcus sp. CCUG 61487]|uniref:bifunctional o-acetylhomoserine/o-acetylserine sulfhydrylase n=1 Tax=Blastococcus sp. CCUG 61487 TaxID=1840703 RepID=UPI0010C0F71D|nr:bifunctional o-acetylhomoserine/o-acetylserine sulfhydrylase [Blastococcus sp. CCUG 61487]TKJ34071.1 O-acetyl-L-homoserine sulfhydrolase [Blastococcus sp. CCUG 61487]